MKVCLSPAGALHQHLDKEILCSEQVAMEHKEDLSTSLFTSHHGDEKNNIAPNAACDPRDLRLLRSVHTATHH